jgi:hypothetical protein
MSDFEKDEEDEDEEEPLLKYHRLTKKSFKNSVLRQHFNLTCVSVSNRVIAIGTKEGYAIALDSSGK